MGHDIKEINPYPNKVYNIIDEVCLGLMRPCGFFLDHFLSCFFSTTKELKQPISRFAHVIFTLPLYGTLYLLFFPLGLVAFLVWVCICQKRKPFRISCRISPTNTENQTRKNAFTLGTTNICLMQEILSRFNNLSHSYQRASIIGDAIAKQQIKLKSKNKANTDESAVQNGYNKDNTKFEKDDRKKRVKSNKQGESDMVDMSILTEFPELDVLLIQETWDLTCARKLVSRLHQYFSYIVFDAVENGLWKNGYMNNSGVMIASRYPLMEVNFTRYKDRCKYCTMASKGLLQIKFDLGKTEDGRQAVGYAYNTHLQVYEGDQPVQVKQLDAISEMTENFRKSTLRPNEVVLWDILGGDFNMDNMSPMDESKRDHTVFKTYKDVCRVRPGLDDPRTVGTEMRFTNLHNSEVSTPEGLKAALQDPYLRRYYILDADLHEITPEVTKRLPPTDSTGQTVASPIGGKRRVDFLMYRNTDNVVGLACNPVTQLAGLTDHISYSLTCKTQSLA